MPLNIGHDLKGWYMRWSDQSKYYYYTPSSLSSIQRALNKVIKQMQYIWLYHKE